MILAKYPFLSQSSDYIKELGVTLEEAITGLAYEESREIALNRVLTGIRGAKIEIYGNQDQMVLSYPIARAMVSSIREDYLTARYALAEAKSAYLYLKDESPKIVELIARDLSVVFFMEGEGVRVSFRDFLALSTSSSLRSPKWRLVNREVRDGYVKASSAEFARLLQEKIRMKILNELPLDVPDYVVEGIEDYLAQIRQALAQRRRGEEIVAKGLKAEWLPPCMKSLIQRARDGENLPHSARFALASFLNKLNMPEEKILDLLSSSPDFDETMARYQVEHITGKISATVYSPPSCPTMKSESLCIDPDELCAGVKHPLTYYFRKARK
jgi:DNA primase large subunit